MKKIALLISIIFCLSFVSCTYDKNKTVKTTTAETNVNMEVKTEPKPEPEPVRQYVNLTFAGDVLFHIGQINSGYLGSGKGYDFNYMFQDIKPQTEKGDLSLTCLETSMRTDWKPTGYPCFNTPPQVLDALKNAGFDIINLANNHVVDTGEKGFYGLLDNIKSRGLQYFGSAKPEEDKTLYVEKNGIKLAFLGYTYGTNGIKAPDNTVNYIDESKIKSDIDAAKSKSDFVIVWMHMGTEYVRNVEKDQYTLYRKVADMGADCVIGSHPHVPKKSEIYSTNGREVPIVYSLGNFISAQRKEQHKYSDVGLISHMTIMKEGNKTEIIDMDAVPIYVLKYNRGGKVIYRVVECSKIDDFKEATNDQKSYVKEVYAELSKEHDFSVFKNNK